MSQDASMVAEEVETASPTESRLVISKPPDLRQRTASKHPYSLDQ